MSGTENTDNYQWDEYVYKIDMPRSFPAVYRRMVDTHMKAATQRFINKAMDYDPSVFKFLGEKGQFSDMSRKFLKMKSVVWDGTIKDLNNESLVEIIDDLIGHCLIMRYLIVEQGS